MFDPAIDQILDGGDSGNLLEKAAQILTVATDGIRKLLQGDRLGVMFVYIRNDLLVAVDFLLGIFRKKSIGGQEHFLFCHNIHQLQ